MLLSVRTCDLISLTGLLINNYNYIIINFNKLIIKKKNNEYKEIAGSSTFKHTVVINPTVSLT